LFFFLLIIILIIIRNHLSEDTILKLTCETSLASIIELNLTCCNLQSIKILSELKNLRSLNLAFNDLVKLDDLCFFYSLESIDLSYNKLITLDGMKGLTKLIFFIATNNFLKKSLDDILTLRRYCPNILHLDLRGNPFDKVRRKYMKFNLYFRWLLLSVVIDSHKI
jgi:Leucine-rich repeat (LRR) protein